MLDAGFVFHWDNAPVHTAVTVRKFLEKKNLELLENPPYSPDLAPADYFLFPKLKASWQAPSWMQNLSRKTGTG